MTDQERMKSALKTMTGRMLRIIDITAGDRNTLGYTGVFDGVVVRIELQDENALTPAADVK